MEKIKILSVLNSPKSIIPTSEIQIGANSLYSGDEEGD
jgi:hypothetical protein